MNLENKSMIAKRALGKVNRDANFAAAGAAKEAIAKYGKEKVVDATLGVIRNDKLEFASLPTAEEVYRKLPAQELMDYAPISGLPEFRKAAVDFVFMGHQPKGSFAAASATPGGTGGLRNALENYVEEGESYLIPDWHWGPYTTMGREVGSRPVEYSLFDAEGKRFNIQSIEERAREILKTQDSLLTIFNTPAQNPTGYSMSNGDWESVLALFRGFCEKDGKKIIVLWDMAYTDYAGDKDEVRDFLKHFDNMPENMLLLCAFSMSKAFLIYGMRSGALVCCSSSEAAVSEFEDTMAFTNRNTWSNGSRGAQRLLAAVMADPELRKKTDEEREAYRHMLEARGKKFTEDAAAAGLEILPYRAGFFLTIPCRDAQEASLRLRSENIFVSPFGRGVRFTVSAVPLWQMDGVASKIKSVVDAL